MIPRGYSDKDVCAVNSLKVIVCVVPESDTGVGVAVGLGVGEGVTKGGRVGVGVRVGSGVGVGTRVGVGVGVGVGRPASVGRADVGVAGGVVGSGVPDGGAQTVISLANQSPANHLLPLNWTVVVPCGMGVQKLSNISSPSLPLLETCLVALVQLAPLSKLNCIPVSALMPENLI